MHGALRLHIATGDPGRLTGGPRGDDHADATVATASHGSSTGIDQEGNQEALPAQLAAAIEPGNSCKTQN